MRNIIASQKLTESQTIVIVEMVLKANRWADRRGAVKLLITNQDGIDNLYEVEKLIGNPHYLEVGSFCFDLEKVGPGSEYNEKLAEMEAQLEEIISMHTRENPEFVRYVVTPDGVEEHSSYILFKSSDLSPEMRAILCDENGEPRELVIDGQQYKQFLLAAAGCL